MRDRPKVGEILVQAGIIDELQLKSALGEQKQWGRRLGATLIKLGMVEEGHLIRALAAQLGLPVASLEGKRIPAEVIGLVPARVAGDHGVIPLFVKYVEGKGQLFLGMEDPSNLEVLDDLAFRTGLEIHSVMVGPTDLATALDRYYHKKPRRPERQPIELPDSPVDGSITMSEPCLVLIDPAEEAGTPPAPLSGPMPESMMPAPMPPLTPIAKNDSSTTVVEVKIPEALEQGVARAVDETERTRFVVKALTQLLVEKGLLSLSEIQERVAKLKGEGGEESGPPESQNA